MFLLPDFIIINFLVIDGILACVFAWLYIKRRKNTLKKARLTFILACFTLFAWLIVFYGSFIEPRLLIVKTQQINLSKNPKHTISIALIADIHVGPYKQEDYLKKIVNKTNALRPDVILLGGDFVFDGREQTKYFPPLAGLKAPLGVFAVLGNHDYGESWPTLLTHNQEVLRGKTVRAALEALGIDVLLNEGKVLTAKDDDKIALLGIDDMWFGKDDISAALSQANFTGPKILLSHNPDAVIEAEELGINLVLAGHTHGGQIRLPFIGSVPEIPDNLGRAYDYGLYNFGNTQLFVTAGAGEVGPRARLFIPPEIAMLEVNY